MSLAELESFSIPEGREYVGGLVTPRAAADTWEGLRLLHIAANYQLPEGESRAREELLVDLLVQGCQEYAAAVETSEEERQDVDFRTGIEQLLMGLFDTELTQAVEARGITVEGFVEGYYPYESRKPPMYERGKELVWEYVRYLTAAILTSPALEAVPA